jgi:hypothetical protein
MKLMIKPCNIMAHNNTKTQLFACRVDILKVYCLDFCMVTRFKSS